MDKQIIDYAARTDIPSAWDGWKTPAPPRDEDAAKRIREERAARKAANFAKRNCHEN